MLIIIGLPLFSLLYLFSEKRRATLLPRFGFQDIEVSAQKKKTIWIHALSVGEVNSALPFVRVLNKRYPDIRIVFSASTQTGFNTARKTYLKPTNPNADQLIYFPFDVGFAIDRVVQKIQADAVVLIETDVWPWFVKKMKNQNIPVVLINARLSKRSLKGYQWAAAAGLNFHRDLAQIMVQSRLDKDRFERLGIDEQKISITGNLKFDQTIQPVDSNTNKNLKQMCGLPDKSIVFLAGSTHAGEEEILGAVFKNVKQVMPELVMIIVPRDPNRGAKINDALNRMGLASVLLSQVTENIGVEHDHCIVIVDSIGILTKLYAVCQIAFIGGSMVSQGGHNPLEAAVFSKPLLFGRDMSDFVWIAQTLLDNGGAKEVASQEEMEQQLIRIIKDPVLAQQMGEKNRQVYTGHSGAAERTLEQMEANGFV